MYHKNANKKQKMCPLCPLAGPTMPEIRKSQPVAWASTARRMGIRSPSHGHPQNKRWATSARRTGSKCPKDGMFTFYNLHFCIEKVHIKSV